jgi:hypothetical protein
MEPAGYHAAPLQPDRGVRQAVGADPNYNLAMATRASSTSMAM